MVMDQGGVDAAGVDDETLLRRYQDGSVDAFEALLQRYERPLFNFILRSVRNRARAEELLQEVFVRVIQRSHAFENKARFSTWLYTIARNLCIDHQRRMAHRQHRSLDAPTRPGEPAREPAAGPQASTERTAMRGELQKRIAAAVEALPEAQREVFLLRQLEALPYREIGQIVGVAENTVKSRMRYALERLQAALADYRDALEELR